MKAKSLISTALVLSLTPSFFAAAYVFDPVKTAVTNSTIPRESVVWNLTDGAFSGS